VCYVRSCRGKKSKRLDKVKRVERDAYQGLKLDTKVELIRALIPLGLMHGQGLLDEEVTQLAGTRYVHKVDSALGTRHGSNARSVRLAGQRIGLRVPRVRDAHGELTLRSYAALQGAAEVDEVLLKRVLYGISCRNYEAALAIPGAIGWSSSSVSRGFVAASAAKLKAFQARSLTGEDSVALMIDGKRFAKATLVVALGVTLS
jgi:putative transposase